MEQPTHRQIAQQLREKTLSEERFRLAASHIDEAFWLSCPDERKVYYVSPAYETIIGRSCDSLYADPASWIESLHPEDRKRIREAIGTRGPGLHRLERRKPTLKQFGDDTPYLRGVRVPQGDEP